MSRCATFVIAGTQSGAGKTSFTIALAHALARRGMNIRTFKVGPDFLDPTYLAMASGSPCYNLDGWMSGRDHCRRIFSSATVDADCALVEGVMGLFDGADAQVDEGSTAEVARLLDAPIILVVNAHGMGRSIAALVKGYTTFRTDLRFAGIVANNCGSGNHAALLSESLQAAGLPPLLGAIPRGAFPELASRHLGLVTASREELTGPLLGALADAIETNISLETLLPQMKATKRETSTSGRKLKRPAAGINIGVALDEAFHFYYQDLFDALREAGCGISFFSPLNDDKLPEGLSGLYIGGGYPEIFAERLSENGAMLAAIREYALSGQPLYAECGGLIYLSRGIEDGSSYYPLSGVLPARTRMLKRRKALGYVEATLTEDSLWGLKGDILRGHEFHYSELIEDPTVDPAWRNVYSLRRRRTDAVESEGFQRGAVLASYLHIHYASRPAAVASFLERCGGVK